MGHNHGMRRKTRYKLKKMIRKRGISPVIKAIQEFEKGSKVHIIIDPSIHKGMPHPRFHGRTGEVLGKRGRAFELKVTDGDATKMIIAFPEHLASTEMQIDSNTIRLYRRFLDNIKEKNKTPYISNLFDSIMSDIKKAG